MLSLRAQDPQILVSIVDDFLIYHNFDDNRIKQVRLSNGLIQADVPRGLEYDPNNCIFYCITSVTNSPKLYSITKEGEVTFIARLSMSDGSNLYSCEGIAYDSSARKFYVSIRQVNSDNTTFNIAELNTSNAICTKVASLNTNGTKPDDADFLEFYDDYLVLGDIYAPNTDSYVFLFDPDGIKSSKQIHFSNASLRYAELSVINDKLFIHYNNRFYSADLTKEPINFSFEIAANYNGQTITLSALAHFNSTAIFDNVNLPYDTTICNGDSIQLSGGGISNLVWSDGISNTTYAKQQGKYWATYTSKSCTFTSDTFRLAIKSCSTCEDDFALVDTNIILFPSDTILCESSEITLNIPEYAGWQITWNDGTTGSSKIITAAGEYYASYSNGSCTFYSTSINVSFRECITCEEYYELIKDRLSLGSDLTICEGESHSIWFADVDSVRWNDGSLSRGKHLLFTGDYWATVYVDTCAFATDTINVQVNLCEDCELQFPTAFTPTKNNLNEKFAAVTSDDCYYTVEEFNVYNRWGEKLYSSDKFLTWDGLYKGVLVQQDVYFFTGVVRIDATNERKKYSGLITVVY